jgi:Phasin protein
MAAVLPENFRQALKLSLEDARRNFETLITASEKTWTAEGTLLPSQSGIAALFQEMSKLARSNVDANFRAAQKLADAESAEHAFRLYVEHMHERMAALTQQLQELGSLTAKAVRTPADDKPVPATAGSQSQLSSSKLSSIADSSYVTPEKKATRREAANLPEAKAPTPLAATESVNQTKAPAAATRAAALGVSKAKKSSRKVSPRGGKQKSSGKKNGRSGA